MSSSPSRSIFYRLFSAVLLRSFLVVALNNNRHTSARSQKIFTLPNMMPLSIRESLPRPGCTGVLPPALFLRMVKSDPPDQTLQSPVGVVINQWGLNAPTPQTYRTLRDVRWPIVHRSTKFPKNGPMHVSIFQASLSQRPSVLTDKVDRNTLKFGYIGHRTVVGAPGRF